MLPLQPNFKLNDGMRDAVHVGPVGVDGEDLDVVKLWTLFVFTVTDAITDEPQLVLAEFERPESKVTNVFVERIVLKNRFDEPFQSCVIF